MSWTQEYAPWFPFGGDVDSATVNDMPGVVFGRRFPNSKFGAGWFGKGEGQICTESVETLTPAPVGPFTLNVAVVDAH